MLSWSSKTKVVLGPAHAADVRRNRIMMLRGKLPTVAFEGGHDLSFSSPRRDRCSHSASSPFRTNRFHRSHQSFLHVAHASSPRNA